MYGAGPGYTWSSEQESGAKSRQAAINSWWFSNRGNPSPTAKTIVRGSTGNSSGSGGALTGPPINQIRRSTRSVVGTETSELDDGKTTVGLEYKPGGAPSTTAAPSDLRSDSAMV